VRALAERGLALASRFGGGPPSGRLDGVWDALERPAPPEAAAALAGGRGGDAPPAAGLAGLAAAFEPSARSSAWRAALEGL
jgi:hypothetical protein